MPEAKYFEELPVPLRGEIVLVQAGQALQECSVFCHLGEEVLRRYSAAQLAGDVVRPPSWGTLAVACRVAVCVIQATVCMLALGPRQS